jgi:hypothetical protein
MYHSKQKIYIAGGNFQFSLGNPGRVIQAGEGERGQCFDVVSRIDGGARPGIYCEIIRIYQSNNVIYVEVTSKRILKY